MDLNLIKYKNAGIHLLDLRLELYNMYLCRYYEANIEGVDSDFEYATS